MAERFPLEAIDEATVRQDGFVSRIGFASLHVARGVQEPVIEAGSKEEIIEDTAANLGLRQFITLSALTDRYTEQFEASEHRAGPLIEAGMETLYSISPVERAALRELAGIGFLDHDDASTRSHMVSWYEWLIAEPDHLPEDVVRFRDTSHQLFRELILDPLPIESASFWVPPLPPGRTVEVQTVLPATRQTLDLSRSFLRVRAPARAERVEAEDPPALGRRRKRIPDVESSGRLLRAGLEILEKRGGLTTSLAHISFEEIIQDADVARSAAYRVWPDKNIFLFDLVCELVHPDWDGAVTFDDTVYTKAMDHINDKSAQLDTATQRRELLEDIVRDVMAAHVETYSQSARWRNFISLTSLIISMPESEDRAEILEHFQAANRSATGKLAAFYETIFNVLGVRPALPEAGFAPLIHLTQSTAQDFAQGYLIRPESAAERFPADKDGKRTWSLAALSLRTFMRKFLEPDPDYDQAAAWGAFIAASAPYRSPDA